MRVFINADGSHRPYTPEENAEQDVLDAVDAEHAATLTDLAERVARIEAHLWPAPPDPTTPDDPDVADWAGIWPDGGLLREGGTVWRNVAGVPLTTPPSGFPGTPSQWQHLFVAVLAPAPEPEPEPTRPVGYVGDWSASARYEVGDVVSRSGRYWRCLVGHGAEYQGAWAPGVAHTVWTDLGPTT